MLCQLCLKDKPLIKNSHIIPNFMYRGLFDDAHKLANVNLSDATDVTYLQTGFKEGGILCSDCDNAIIGKLERYACNFLYSNHSTIEKEIVPGDNDNVPFTRYKNLDYAQLKLFFLSLLWKSHISKHYFFKDINLGTKYSEQLRKMILEGNPGPEDRFEVILIKIEASKSKPTKSIIQPRRIKSDGNTSYLYHINEIMYHFNVSSHNKMAMYEKGIIRKDGILDMAVLNDTFGMGYFDSFVGQRLFFD